MINFNTVTVSDSITRPANTTAYTAGDVISDTTGDAHYSFAGLVKQPYGNNSASIDTATIVSSANQSTLPDVELWLFHTDITAVADNSAFAPTDAETLTLVGVIDFAVASWKVGNAGSGASGNAICHVTNIGLVFNVPSASTLYGQLVVRNAYTPVSGEIFTVYLTASRD